VTGRVTLHRVRNVDHHWAGRIDHIVAGTELPIVPLAAEGHRIKWSAALSSRLYPHHTACAGISFQSRDGCRVRIDKLRDGRVIPVTDNDSIIAEVNRRKVCWREFSISVAISSNGILDNGRAPRIVRFE